METLSRVGWLFCKVLVKCETLADEGGAKKSQKGENILLPASVKDTDGNIITQGPCGGT